ncbi:phage major capsid protein [Saccharopolyspora shandongensis]|uniref:Phage major capsid protein, HK97 family n=1 Tax=Saccharopolyspora shandongensis TaxID=418495 RepID=A0A1H3TM33_9PSEU|nr:phage major capsid protein [Saccharopolyspora shandongensis]SDZ51304.1 phage major capsid protein, HK97 family [Saccharopolyspora shandongensis]
MPTLREQYQATLSRAAELAKTATDEGRDFTDDEITEITDLKTKADELGAKVKAADDAQAAAAELAGKSAAPVAFTSTRDRAEDADAETFGDAFVKSAAYQAFRKEHPAGVGQGTPVNIGRVKVGSLPEWFARRKATLDTSVGRIQPVRMPTVDMVDRDRLTLLDLVSRGRTDGNFEYVQITGVTRNAAIVAEGGLKPTSDMSTDIADAKVYTYADGYDVTNQLLADAPAFASYMNNELSYSLDNVVEEKLLNGTGTNGEPRGLLNTTGVQQQAYTAGADPIATAKALIPAIRKAITKVTRLPGGQVTAVLMSPEDDEAFDLLQDANERYYSGGPFSTGPATIWGRPRATSERIAPGTIILGDFRQIALLDREGLSVLAFNQHKDYAQRNMTYVRAELRAAQVIWKPNRLVVVKAGTGA